MPDDENEVTLSGGNVFATLGIDEPEEYQLKSRLASLIYDDIEAKGWTQTRAAEVLGIEQLDVSDIRRGLLDRFSAERLLVLLSRLGQRVTITIGNDATPTREIVIAASDPEETTERANTLSTIR